MWSVITIEASSHRELFSTTRRGTTAAAAGAAEAAGRERGGPELLVVEAAPRVHGQGEGRLLQESRSTSTRPASRGRSR